MSKEIIIEVNPYLDCTQPKMQGDFFDGRSRLFRVVEGNPMSTWLEQRRTGYQRWEGFLPEAVRELNDDDLSFLFYGTVEDFTFFRDTLHRQEAWLDRMGFSNVHYSVFHRERFTPDRIRMGLRTIRDRSLKRKILIPPTQALILSMDIADEKLFREQPAELWLLKQLRETYIKICEDCEKADKEQKRNSWNQHKIKIESLFERGEWDG